jgi:hypothetical protein
MDVRWLGGAVTALILVGCANGNGGTGGATAESTSATTSSSTTTSSSGAGGAKGTGGSGGSGGTGGAPACAGAGSTCAVPVTGWSGPVILFDGDPATLPSSCPSTYPTTLYAGVRGPAQAPPASCSACACAAGVTCTPGAIQQYTDMFCHNPLGLPIAQPAPGTCQEIADPIGSPMDQTFLEIAPPTATASCTPSGGTATLPSPGWTAAGLACGGAPFASCAGGGQCLPPPPTPFGGTACVYQAGDVACPAGYPDKHAFTGASDTRGCSICTCAPSGTAGCTLSTTLYAAAQCVSVTVVEQDDGMCGAWLGLIPSFEAKVTGTSGSSTCTPSAVMPTGTVAADDQTTTFCCAG